YEHSKTLWLFGTIASLFTALYMFRMLFLTFFGSFRGSREQEHHLHESPGTMTVPLMVLAALSVIGGVLGFPEFWGLSNWMAHHLQPLILRPGYPVLGHDTEWMLMGL